MGAWTNQFPADKPRPRKWRQHEFRPIPDLWEPDPAQPKPSPRPQRRHTGKRSRERIEP